MPTEKRLPGFVFYPTDHRADPGLQACSLAARGVWTDMLCIAHDSPRRGYLEYGPGKPITPGDLARLVGHPPKEVAALLTELESRNVFSRDEHGVIYCRRMVREEEQRQRDAANGRKGGNPALKKTTSNPPVAEGVNPPVAEGVNPPVAEGVNLQAKPSQTKPKEEKTPLPPKGERRRRDPKPEPEGFAEFWKSYPRKHAKDAAVKAWTKLQPDEALRATIAAAIERQNRSEAWQRDAGQFIPHASTWLNGRRWEDEAIEPRNELGRIRSGQRAGRTSIRVGDEGEDYGRNSKRAGPGDAPSVNGQHPAGGTF